MRQGDERENLIEIDWQSNLSLGRRLEGGWRRWEERSESAVGGGRRGIGGGEEMEVAEKTIGPFAGVAGGGGGAILCGGERYEEMESGKSAGGGVRVVMWSRS